MHNEHLFFMPLHHPCILDMNPLMSQLIAFNRNVIMVFFYFLLDLNSFGHNIFFGTRPGSPSAAPVTNYESPSSASFALPLGAEVLSSRGSTVWITQTLVSVAVFWRSRFSRRDLSAPHLTAKRSSIMWAPFRGVGEHRLNWWEPARFNDGAGYQQQLT